MDVMTITPQHIKKPKIVGKLAGKNVLHVETTGGWNMIVAQKGEKFETLGVGPHRGLAMHIAQKHYPDLQYTGLSKADYVDPACFAIFLPEWEAVTAAIRQLQGY